MKDGKPSKNLSTYTSYNSLWNRILSVGALNKNLVDRGAYAGMHSKESAIVDFIKERVGLSSEGVGIITSGSSEAILAGLAFHLCNFRRNNPDCASPNLVVSELSHNVFVKFAVLFGVELRTVKVQPDGTIDLGQLELKISAETFCVVAILGTTETGTVDDLKAVSRIAAARRVPLHIDAAIGGGVLPFVEAAPPWNFTQLELASLNISLGKYFNGVPGVGILLLKDASVIPDTYQYEMDYLAGGRTGDRGLLCTRSSFHVHHLHRHISRLGTEGYRKYIRTCCARAKRYRAHLRMHGFETFETPLPVVVFSHRSEALMDQLVTLWRRRGYTVSYSPVRAFNNRRYCRIVFRSNITEGVLRYLIRTTASISKSHDSLSTYDQRTEGTTPRLNLDPIR